jgi:hypothetical protein
MIENNKKTKYVFIGAAFIAMLLFAISYSDHGVSNEKKKKYDVIYTYLYIIEDSIISKNFPINIDSLNNRVDQEKDDTSIYLKLVNLEDSVKRYKKPNN